MIIFYNKQTGVIEGTIHGRVHGDGHLNMYVGSPDVNERIVVEWKPVYIEEAGIKVKIAEFRADTDQWELFEKFELAEDNVNNYKVDLKSRKLIPHGN